LNDATTRTDAACRTYPLSSPVTLSSLDDITLAIQVTYSSASTLFIGQGGITLAPTTTAASAPKHATGQSSHPTLNGVVTHG
jgi:hypothetical protein